MRLVEQSIEGLYLVECDPYLDDRGRFSRRFCKREFKASGIDFEVCQTNVSVNPTPRTLRGFHYQQTPSSEKKLLNVVSGSLFHAVVDVRDGSETFLEHKTFRLSAGEDSGVLVPEGVASAFLTMEPDTVVIYQMADFHDPGNYSGLRYNDPLVGIEWPAEPVLISERDLGFPDFDPRCP